MSTPWAAVAWICSYATGPDQIAMELKVWRDGERDPLGDGLAQLDRYLAGLGLDPPGWSSSIAATAFPPSPSAPPWRTPPPPGGRDVTVVRA